MERKWCRQRVAGGWKGEGKVLGYAGIGVIQPKKSALNGSLPPRNVPDVRGCVPGDSENLVLEAATHIRHAPNWVLVRRQRTGLLRPALLPKSPPMVLLCLGENVLLSTISALVVELMS